MEFFSEKEARDYYNRYAKRWEHGDETATQHGDGMARRGMRRGATRRRARCPARHYVE
uniref:FAR1 domain-containing protein n=1 Tax=Oryza punctata TaxID=4537 RepID=A0A0E0JKU7_ORYPU